MEKVIKPVIKYEVKNGFLYVNNSRYKIDAINCVKIDKKYYFGMDDTPGVYECSLCINQARHYLQFSILDEDSDIIKAEKRKLLDDLVADIKKLINF